MNNSLVIFATQTPNAHIAIVEADNDKKRYKWDIAQQQLKDAIYRVNHLQYRIELTNGTIVYFGTADTCQHLLGWQFDRIETTIPAIIKMPENFLERRLKMGIASNVGISLSGED